MNKNTLINLLIFATGAAIGSVVTLRLVETKYEQIIDEELNSMREFYENYIDELEGREKDEDLEEEVAERATPISKKPDLMEYAARLKENQYNGENKKEEEMMNEAHIRVVSPDEFDDSDFEKVSLSYYSDEVLAYDENDEAIPDEEIDELIGHESLNTFGRFEDDTVYVIDYDSEVAYEICKDYRTYSEVSGQEG